MKNSITNSFNLSRLKRTAAIGLLPLFLFVTTITFGQATVNYGLYSGTGGLHNTFIGEWAGHNATSDNNTFIGRLSGQLTTTGFGNTFLGAYSGYSNNTGSSNTFLGISSGHLNTTGSGNIFIGYNAGYNETGSNKLYIANNNTSQPLIYGEFNNQVLTVNGSLGVGTSSPSDKLTVYDGELTLQTNNNAEDQGILFQNSGASYTWRIYRSDAGSNKADLKFASGLSTNYASLTNRMIIDKDGNVGIATSTVPAGYKLAVNGSVIAEEIRVQLSGNWPDYVFEDHYELPSLKELEAFIRANKHLPDIPGAKEIDEQGIIVGEMQAKLLEKIEELTLYMIELDKKVEKLAAENSALRSNANIKK